MLPLKHSAILHKAFSKSNYRHSELIVKDNVWLKNSSVARQIIFRTLFSLIELVFKRIVGKPSFSDQLKI